MQAKYFKEGDFKEKLYTLTETQIRDHEIITTYMTLIEKGTYSSVAIKELSNKYHLSIKNIERIVYPIPK
jgi:hypothetical protein